MNKIYSHSNKYLYTHLLNVSSNMLDIFDIKKMDLKVFQKENLRKIVQVAGICHDFGKATTFFQKKLKGKKSRFSNHALISAFFSIFLIDELEIPNKKLYKYMLFIVIQRHHGELSATKKVRSSQIKALNKQLGDISQKHFREVEKIYTDLMEDDVDLKRVFQQIEKKGFKRVLKKMHRAFIKALEKLDKEDVIEVFLTINFIFSLLVDSDKKDAANIEPTLFNQQIKALDVKAYIDESFDVINEIDKKRNAFFDEVYNSAVNRETFLYTITAPTGIGKTLTSFGLVNKLKETLGVKKMIYCLPYTSIIDQNYNVFEEIYNFDAEEEIDEIPYEVLIKHHYLTFFDSKNDQGNKRRNELNYLDNKLLLESWESQNIVTTFVQFFESIITNNNSRLKKLHNMINSIIILDEIQAVPVKYYHLIGKVLEVFANRFKTYVILMTATQPNIIPNAIKLIDEQKYYYDKVFNRCILNTSKLKEEITIEAFATKLKESNSDNALVVVNTIQSSLDLYWRAKELLSEKYLIKYLSTNLTPEDRMKKITAIKKGLKANKKILLITTQLIEAGVDLSFEVVYRDIAPLDSLIQVAGRCNRNSEMRTLGKVHLINLINDKGEMYSNKVYDSKLLEITKEVLQKEKYGNSEFYDLSKVYFDKIRNVAISKSKGIIDAMKKMNYNGMDTNLNIKDFKLIEETYYDTRVVICQKKEVEDMLFQMALLKNEIKKEGFDAKLYREFDKLKKEVEKYAIDIYNYQLDRYREDKIVSVVKELNIVYFSYEDQKKYVYDKEVGFLEQPKSEIQTTLIV